LLRILPDAQKESDTASKGDAVLVSKFHSAAQVVCPLIIRGSFVALSINIARVGDTTIVSNAITPDVPF
jgi:formiminotetrahydrofolate cyclodeaminase